MSCLKKAETLTIKLRKLMNYAIANNSDRETIHEILHILYTNQWYLYWCEEDRKRKHIESLVGHIKKKLDQFEKGGWREATLWKYKLRHILQ